MHNCRATRKRLIELALDKTPSNQTEPLLDELERCRTCREEFASLRNVLRVADQAMEAALPSDSFSSGYQVRLRQSLERDSASRASSLASRPPRPEAGAPGMLRSLLPRLATASVSVPLPVAAIMIVLFGLSIAFAMHSRRQLIDGPLSGTSPIVTRIVEVPVIRERTVTRVVYRDRSRHNISDIARIEKTARSESKVMDRRNESVANTPISLVGFKPTSDPKLTIIKGSYRDDK
jgi:hypothetical protein